MQNNQVISNKTLEELENDTWKSIPTESTGLINKVYSIRKKKLRDFTIEDLRIMISQNIGLSYLVPIALSVLKRDLLAEGDYYEGDLLKSVLTSDKGFWKHNLQTKNDIIEIFIKNEGLVNGLEDEEIRNMLKDAFNEFKLRT